MKNTPETKTRRIRDIEEEYGESLRDILIGFREQRCSWKTIAGALEVSQSTLLLWRRGIGLTSDGIRHYEDRESKVDVLAQKMGYSNLEDLCRNMRGAGRTLAQISKKTGLAKSTISTYTPDAMKYQWVVTPALRRSRKNNLAAGRDKQRERRKKNAEQIS
jgi:lambda repressor-like predicted transcriptional regulator